MEPAGPAQGGGGGGGGARRRGAANAPGPGAAARGGAGRLAVGDGLARPRLHLPLRAREPGARAEPAGVSFLSPVLGINHVNALVTRAHRRVRAPSPSPPGSSRPTPSTATTSSRPSTPRSTTSTPPWSCCRRRRTGTCGSRWTQRRRGRSGRRRGRSRRRGGPLRPRYGAAQSAILPWRPEAGAAVA